MRQRGKLALSGSVMAAIIAAVLILGSSFSEAQTYTMRVGHSLYIVYPK